MANFADSDKCHLFRSLSLSRLLFKWCYSRTVEHVLIKSCNLFICIHKIPICIFRIFGGLIRDIKRKAPFYLSDFKDGIHIQCFASFFFVFFACLTPIITFGGLLGSALDNNMVGDICIEFLSLINMYWMGRKSIRGHCHCRAVPSSMYTS